MDAAEYVKKIFEDKILVALSAAWAMLYKIMFPEAAYALAAGAVLGIMCIDLLTKLYALSRQGGGFIKALRKRGINSKSFAKGTLDKLTVFIVMLLICGLSYRISPISDVAIWFTQLVFALMFFRDVLSIIENLNDAGVGGLGLLKRAIKKKMNEYVEVEENDMGTVESEANKSQVLGGSCGAGDERDDSGGENGQ